VGILILDVYNYLIEKGYKIEIRPNTNDKEMVARISNFEHRGFVDNPKIILDLGAHIGAFALWCIAEYPESVVYAYEPAIENYKVLVKNIKLNNLQSRIYSYLAGIEGKRGVSYLAKGDRAPYDMGDFSFVKDIKEDLRPIAILNLRDILNITGHNEIDIMKINIEGSEFSLFHHSLDKDIRRIKVIANECHARYDNKFSLSNKLINRILSLGYSIKYRQGAFITFVRD